MPLRSSSSSSSSGREATKPWVPFAAGFAGGSVAALATCPLEVVKTRFQAKHNKRGLREATLSSPRGLRTAHALLSIYRRDGVRGLWRGVVPHVGGVGPARAAHFGMYHWARDAMNERRRLNAVKSSGGGGGDDDDGDGDDGDDAPAVVVEDSAYVHLAAAAWAGFVVHSVTSPIWLVKTRMQLQSGDRLTYTSTWDCVKKVYAGEGVRGFYKGITASYIGLSETAIQFAMYERAKRELRELRFRRRVRQVGEDSLGVAADVEIKSYETLGLASASKLMASMATYPHEVVRTRLREQTTSEGALYRTFWASLARIAREEGRAGLYGGMGAHLMRVVPNSAILFVTYETVMKLLYALPSR